EGAQGDPRLPEVQGRARVPRREAGDRLQDVQAGVPDRGRHPRHAGGRGEASADVTLAGKLAAHPPARVLLVQTAYLGDTVFTSALFSAVVGFAGGPASLLYAARVPTREKAFSLREADLAVALGAAPGAMRLVPRAEWLAGARSVLGRSVEERLAAICLGSEWPTKIWPTRHVADLVRRLASDGFRPVLLGGPREVELAREVGAAGGCIDTTGNSVGEALAILSLCALAVGGDTGLVHAARALGLPTAAVFGPTPSDVHLFGPRERAVSLGLSCSPCTVHGSQRCPLGHHRCLEDLDAERVASVCREVLA